MPGGIASILSGITGGIGNVAVNVVGAVVNGVRTALTTALRAVLGIMRGVVLGAFQALTTGIIGIVALIGVAVASLTGIVVRATGALTAMARSINDLRGATGMSAGRAGGLINRFNAFGIRPDATAAMFENSNPLTMGMRARMMGASSFDAPGAIAAMAQRFQSMSASGPFGNRMARNMLGDFDTAEFRRVLMQPISMLKQQEAFQNRTQAALGVDPGLIAAVGQQTEMLTNRFRVFMDTVLIRLASEVLPFLNARFEQFTQYVVANAPKIADAITNGVNIFINTVSRVSDWLSTNGPAIGHAIQQGVQFAWNALVSLGDWLYSSLPKLVLGGLSFIANGLSGILSGIAGFLRGVQAGSSAFNTIVDHVIAGAMYLSGIATFVGNIFKGIYNAFAFGWNHFSSVMITGIYDVLLGVAKVIVNSPLMAAADAVAKRMGVPSLRDAVNGASFVNPMTAMKLDYAPLGNLDDAIAGPKAIQDWFNKVRKSQSFENNIQAVEDMAARTGAFGRDIDARNTALGTTESRSRDFANFFANLNKANPEAQQQTALLKQAVSLLAQQVANSDPRHLAEYHRQAAQLIATVVSQDAADQYMMLSRT